MKRIILVVLFVATITDLGQTGLVGKSQTRYKVLTLDESPEQVKPFQYPTPKKVEKKVLSCYYNVPSMNDRPFPVFPEQIDPFLCTHIMVAFGHVDNNCSLVPGDANDIEVFPISTLVPLFKLSISIICIL